MTKSESVLERQKIFPDAAGRRSFATFPLTVGRVVVITDLTPQSDAALDYSANLARYFDARVTLLHVCPPALYTDSFPGIITHTDLFPGMPAIGGNGVRGPTTELELLRLQAEIQRRGARCDARLRCGPYAKEAFRVAAERAADLLVISEHHLSWFREFIEEDHTGTFLIGTPCPVVVVADQSVIAPCPQFSQAEKRCLTVRMKRTVFSQGIQTVASEVSTGGREFNPLLEFLPKGCR